MRSRHAAKIKFNTHVYLFFGKVLVRLFSNSLHFQENLVPQLTWFDSFTFSHNIKKFITLKFLIKISGLYLIPSP